jgi:preprotein translocase subunit SecG
MASGILGSKTGDFLTWVTIVLVGIFLSLALVMAKFYRPTVSEFGAEQRVQKEVTSDSEPPPPADLNKPQDTDAGKNVDVNSPGV